MENITLWDETVPDRDVVRAACVREIHHDIAVAGRGLRQPCGRGRRKLERRAAPTPGDREGARGRSLHPRSGRGDERARPDDRGVHRRSPPAARVHVPHRPTGLSTIRDCDEIVVLERGKIVQRGTHDELIAQGGLYTDLIAAAASERSVDSGGRSVSPVTLTGSRHRLELAGNADTRCSTIRPPPGRSPRHRLRVRRPRRGRGVGRWPRVRVPGRCGGALFGMSVGARRRLLAVGRPGTLLERLDHDDERLIAGWVHALSSAIGDPAPRDVVELRPTGPSTPPTARRTSPGSICSGRPSQQAPWNWGVGDAVIDATSGPLPLSSATWLRSVGTGRIAPERAGVARSVPSRRPRRTGEPTGEHERGRAARSRARLAADDAILDDGLNDLLTFFEDGAIPVDHVGVRVAIADPLLAACRLVGGALGVDVEAPPAWQAGGRDSLAAIARACTCVAR